MVWTELVLPVARSSFVMVEINVHAPNSEARETLGLVTRRGDRGCPTVMNLKRAHGGMGVHDVVPDNSSVVVPSM